MMPHHPVTVDIRPLFYRSLRRVALLLSLCSLLPVGLSMVVTTPSLSVLVLVAVCTGGAFLLSLSLYAMVHWHTLLKQITPIAHWAALGKATAHVAHDLCSPLASLRGLLFALEEERAGSRALRDEHLKLLQLATRRLQRITDEVLDTHQAHQQSAARVDMHAVLLGIVEEYRLHPALKEVHFVTDFCDRALYIAGQKNRLERMAANLIKNGIEAMRFHGTMTITTMHSAPTTAQLRIQDTGPGLSQEQISQIMAEQQRSQGKHNGHGLGLAFVQEVLAAHDGRLEIESVVGHGATFRLTLPAAEADTVPDNVIALAQ